MRRPALVAFFITAGLQLPLHGGWLTDWNMVLANPFHGGHVWAADVVGQAWWSGQWPSPTAEAGFPDARTARFVAWAVLAIAGLMHPVLSSVLTVHLMTLLGPALGAAAMVVLARKLTAEPERSSWGLVLGSCLYGLAPITLGAAVSGQLENTQSWVLPLLLWAVPWSAKSTAAFHPAVRWVACAAIWALGAATSPYLAMTAGFAIPWVWSLTGARAGAIPSLFALGGALAVHQWLGPRAFSAERDLFKPAYAPEGWPPLWGTPLPVADLDTLLSGITSPQPLAMVIHQPYLGLILVAMALFWGRRRMRWSYPLLMGVFLALGPVLGWNQNAVALGTWNVPLPGMIIRWLDLPLAHGGQYYRCIILAHLALAGMLATAPRRRGLGIGFLICVADFTRTVSMFGLPWPTTPLPSDAWAEWKSDPTPGAVVHLPMFSPHIIPCHPIRLAGHAIHERPLADMPRSWVQAPEDDVLASLEQCTRRGQGCQIPALSDLEDIGFRYAVLDLKEVPERTVLKRRLNAAWGAPDGEANGLEWWTTDKAP